jgi:hypothetical protein
MVPWSGDGVMVVVFDGLMVLYLVQYQLLLTPAAPFSAASSYSTMRIHTGQQIIVAMARSQARSMPSIMGVTDNHLSYRSNEHRGRGQCVVEEESSQSCGYKLNAWSTDAGGTAVIAVLPAPPKITWDDIAGDPAGANVSIQCRQLNLISTFCLSDTSLCQAIVWSVAKRSACKSLGLAPPRGGFCLLAMQSDDLSFRCKLGP